MHSTPRILIAGENGFFRRSPRTRLEVAVVLVQDHHPFLPVFQPMGFAAPMACLVYLDQVDFYLKITFLSLPVGTILILAKIKYNPFLALFLAGLTMVEEGPVLQDLL